MLWVVGFKEKVEDLASSNLIQQGGDLAYLIRYDPEFRGVRREHLEETGRRVRPRGAIRPLIDFLAQGLNGYRFSYFVISAAPKEVVVATLEDIVDADHIFGTEFDYVPHSGDVRAIARVRAGYGKVAALDEIERGLGVAPDRIIYIGDGSSDVHAMLHVNSPDGFTIAVSENRQLVRIAKSIVLSDYAFSILVPILSQILGWRIGQIRSLFERNGLIPREWEHARTDGVRLADIGAPAVEVA
jgi:phosphoserine phosphatase